MPYAVNIGDVLQRIGGIAAAVITANATGSAIDLNDYDGELAVILNSAQGTGNANNTLDIKLTECDTSGGSYTDVASGAFTQVTGAGGASSQKISLNKAEMKRYVKFVEVVGGTSPSFVHSAELLGVKRNPA